jgi:hypothetical protein
MQATHRCHSVANCGCCSTPLICLANNILYTRLLSDELYQLYLLTYFHLPYLTQYNNTNITWDTPIQYIDWTVEAVTTENASPFRVPRQQIPQRGYKGIHIN